MCWGQAFNVYVTAHLCGVNQLKIQNPIEAASTTLRVSAYSKHHLIPRVANLGISLSCDSYDEQKCEFVDDSHPHDHSPYAD